MNLFQSGQFTLHSGGKSNLFINCDALKDADWETLAAEIASRVKFRDVYGVPTGVWKLANALWQYISEEGPTLIVDDVLTSGSTVKEIAYILSAGGVENIQVITLARG